LANSVPLNNSRLLQESNLTHVRTGYSKHWALKNSGLHHYLSRHPAWVSHEAVQDVARHCRDVTQTYNLQNLLNSPNISSIKFCF